MATPCGCSRLSNVFASAPHTRVRRVETACPTPEKQRLYEALKRTAKEGAVFKKLTAPYTPGRPASGGDALKLKFCETASFIVAGVNGKRSVRLSLWRGDQFVPAGNVTIPANHNVPQVGQVVEIRYLYAFRESGILYQPVFLGPRNDVDTSECLASQLKFKAEEDAC